MCETLPPAMYDCGGNAMLGSIVRDRGIEHRTDRHKCVFDILMFLEPFGLLAVLPIPDWLRQFVPAYKATRIITEVLVESLPQCLLQACIYIIIAGYTALELKEAGCLAAELRAVAYPLTELRAAGFSAQALQEVGYGAEELRAAGASLADLTGAGASVADLKAAGISAIGLKVEGITLEQMKAVGYSVKELKAAGFTPMQLHAANFEARELTSAADSRQMSCASLDDLQVRVDVGEVEANHQQPSARAC